MYRLAEKRRRNVNKPTIEDRVKWLKGASEEGLRDFLHEYLEKMEDPEEYRELKKAYDKECAKRSNAYYESLNAGEWI